MCGWRIAYHRKWDLVRSGYLYGRQLCGKEKKNHFSLSVSGMCSSGGCLCLFGALAGMTTLVFSAIRDLLVANDRYTKPMMTVFLILTIVAGVLANTRGLVGLLPVFATVEYTICCHYIVGEKATKCSIFVNGSSIRFDL